MILRDNVEELNDIVILELDVSNVLTSDCVHKIIPVFITDISEDIKRSIKNNDKWERTEEEMAQCLEASG